MMNFVVTLGVRIIISKEAREEDTHERWFIQCIYTQQFCSSYSIVDWNGVTRTTKVCSRYMESGLPQQVSVFTGVGACLSLVECSARDRATEPQRI